jgi:UDP-3-O-[3-hydroxymyristoyl] N-acetylglucosamine deacetylase/3-hydroxyacyl-[acyl-carrier-protein] dehydratase
LKKLQRTVANEAEFTGVGVNSGEQVIMRIKPAEPNIGIVFVRTDLPGNPEVPARIENAGERPFRTSLIKDGVEVQMVEHLMAAFSGMDIHNAVVELSAPEIPCGDGSSALFCELLQKAGAAEQPHPRPQCTVTEPICVRDGDASITAIPGEDGLTISYTLSYPTSLIPSQHYQTTLNGVNFSTEIAHARTFVLASDVEELKLRGLGRGATYKNMLVVDEDGVIENELRYEDEFARHKILDVIGDLYLLGAQLNAYIVAVKSGHALNRKLVHQLRRTMEVERGTRNVESFDIREIQQILPHRFPFLLVDRVLELEGDRRAVGVKNITYNEPFFQGHWPGQPVMPGVLQIEAMAQLAGFLLLRKFETGKRFAFLFAVDKARLRRPVVPGDRLLLEAESIRFKHRIAHIATRASVDGELAAEAEIKFMIVDST